MATSIPAGSGLPPQVRKQVMDEHGNFHPVPETEQAPPVVVPAVPKLPRLHVGDAVTLSGRVMEIQAPQGGQMSVLVQLDNSAGSVWFRGEHLGKQDNSKDERITELEAQLTDALAAADKLQGQIDAAKAKSDADAKAAVDAAAALKAKSAPDQNKAIPAPASTK